MNYTVLKYLRISAEDIDLDGFDKYESNSIGNQRSYIDDFIKKIPEFEGCTVIEECDDGRTGTNFDRPGVQKTIEMAKSGAVQCIIVKDLSRWGRNHLEVGDFLEQKFPAWGVRFISINDMYDSAALNGATGGIDIAFRNLVYEMYSHDLSEKVKSARLAAAKSRKQCCSYPFYGYMKDPADPRKLIIDEESSAVVRKIYNLAESGLTGSQIAAELNKEKFPTPRQRQQKYGAKHQWTQYREDFWTDSHTTKILNDERYTGKQIYGKMRVAEVGIKEKVFLKKNGWLFRERYLRLSRRNSTQKSAKSSAVVTIVRTNATEALCYSRKS
jgi:DNA invertase Pin-like site-specific DNA recombinase